MYDPDALKSRNVNNFTSENGIRNQRRNTYLDGAMPQFNEKHDMVRVVPVAFINQEKPSMQYNDNNQIIIQYLKPIILLSRALGTFPIARDKSRYALSVPWMIYSVVILIVVVGFTGFLKYKKVQVLRSSDEGRFEEAVIDYLFTVYLIPIVINPLAFYEARKQADVLTQLISFEKIYNNISKKHLNVLNDSKPTVLTVILPLLACSTMSVTHLTMANFGILQVIPYCYINVITYMVAGSWYIYCYIIGRIATVIADDFQENLKHIGSSINIANYRSLWMMLARIIRNVGNSFGYVLLFLSLYLFFVITLTIYGLLSQIQEGMSIKDVGLTITALSAMSMLYFTCDEAHYASGCVRTNFQKKILLVELTWLNFDAQQEINMFLRATEMNPTDMTLCGFFDVNRNLFKSLLATMVTYLVVLLQFQISIPEDSNSATLDNSSMIPEIGITSTTIMHRP